MAGALLEDFEIFFIELPAEVRNDLWFMMAILSDENFVFNDGTDIEERSALGLFQAKTRIGRLGNLIQAAAIFDVYFAMDAADRFDGGSGGKRARSANSALYRYASQIDAIEAARQRWHTLRATRFTPTAIALDLIPPGLPNKRATATERADLKERSDSLQTM
jgi:hypothetical protein